MKTYCVNPVFKTVATLVREYYGADRKYDKYMVFFGYNLPDSEHTSLFNEMITQAKVDGYTTVIYQLEQLFRSSYWVNPMTLARLQMVDEIWDYDYENIGFMVDKMRIKTPMKFRPMLYCNSLKTINHKSAKDKDIDILFYGGMNESRQRSLTYIQRNIHPYKIEFIQNVWGSDLDEYIARAKIVLNLHFFPDNRQEQVRMFPLVSNGCCVVSEFSESNHMGNSIMNVPLDDIPGVCRELLRTGAWESFGRGAMHRYKALSADYFKRFR